MRGAEERAGDVFGDQDVGVEPIAETRESIGLVIVQARLSVARAEDRGKAYAAGCYRMKRPACPSSETGEARVLVVPWWSDPRAAPFYPGELPANAGHVMHVALALEGFVGGVRVSQQYVALVCRAWGADILWGIVERGAARYVAAWKIRPAGVAPLPVAAIAPLGVERGGRVDPMVRAEEVGVTMGAEQRAWTAETLGRLATQFRAGAEQGTPEAILVSVGLDQAWPAPELLRKLLHSADMVRDRQREAIGDVWEQIDTARKIARDRLAAWDAGEAPSYAPQGFPSLEAEVLYLRSQRTALQEAGTALLERARLAEAEALGHLSLSVDRETGSLSVEPVPVWAKLGEPLVVELESGRVEVTEGMLRAAVASFRGEVPIDDGRDLEAGVYVPSLCLGWIGRVEMRGVELWGLVRWAPGSTPVPLSYVLETVPEVRLRGAYPRRFTHGARREDLRFVSLGEAARLAGLSTAEFSGLETGRYTLAGPEWERLIALVTAARLAKPDEGPRGP